MKSKKNSLCFAAVGVVSFLMLLGLDQWTKKLAVLHLKEKADVVLIPGVLKLHYLENQGAAFGILQNQQWLFTVMTVIIMAALLYIAVRLPKTKYYLPVYLLDIVLMSGAIGNFWDRQVNRYVVDFIYFELIDFPVFNVADIYVTCSMFIFLLLCFFFYKEQDFEFLFAKPKREEA